MHPYLCIASTIDMREDGHRASCHYEWLKRSRTKRGRTITMFASSPPPARRRPHPQPYTDLLEVSDACFERHDARAHPLTDPNES